MRILVSIKPRFIGDTVMATPLLRGLLAKGHKVAITLRPHVFSVIAPDFPDVKNLDIKESKVFSASRVLRQEKFDAVLIINRSARSALVAWLAQIPVRVGVPSEGRGMLLTHKTVAREDQPEFESDADLARAIGIPLDLETPHLTVSDSERARGVELLEGHNVLIQPGASFKEKALTYDQLGHVSKSLHAAGHRLVLVGGKEEVDHVAPMMELGVPFLNLIGKCSLRETMGVIASADLLVSPDTGLVHLATALGSKALTVFGPSNPVRWGYVSPRNVVLKDASGLMDRVSKESIADAALDMLSRG
ncbi:MAG TPA: glycosyltransferase family 9 protein [Fimbriimonadaceae bacterium]|nr:glycosyltransferase family 9 protein [Fimbriimonadaceae bacterium]